MAAELVHFVRFPGAILVIIIAFMAVTSSGASEMLAVSSLFTFDVYRRYINPKVPVLIIELCFPAHLQ